MLISRKWLSQYLDISQYSIAEIADKITSAGSEVEGIIKQSCGTNLVIGKVIECIEHPNSDHLHCCKVDIGNKVLSIVCGAPNVRKGIKVIVAKVGAKLSELTIKEGNIRGELSEGMICSLLELGVNAQNLSEESKTGIEILADDAQVGDCDPLKYMGLDDEILDIGLTPNRNDCLAAWSFAYECGAVLNEQVKLPSLIEYSDELKSTLKIDVTTDACPKFYGKKIGKVTVKKSPKWMVELLNSSGIKSINNIVDISNIVMLETGQPLHFYDERAIHNGCLEVRDNLNIDYTALDEKTYKIENDDIMITTNSKPIGIAGIMGGNDSKISDDTTSIVIEAAVFNNVRIRNSSRRFALSTDAAMRYQKGIEPLATQKAVTRATNLLVEYADASLLEETISHDTQKYEQTKIMFSLEKMQKILGIEIPVKEVIDVLTRLQFKPQIKGEVIEVEIPSFRQDVKINEDVVEEIIRIVGYDRLPATLPTMSATLGERNPQQINRILLSSMLAHLGMQEVITYTLISEQKRRDQVLGPKKNIELALPMSEDRKFVRGSIIPSILECCAYNQARTQLDFGIFEISNVYGDEQVEEHLALIMSGALQESKWKKWELRSDFYTLKGLIQLICERQGIAANRIKFEKNTIDIVNFHPNRSAVVLIDSHLFGVFGNVHPSKCAELDITEIVGAELSLDILWKIKSSKIKHLEVSKYPSVSRDLALVVKRNVCVDEIYESVLKQRNNSKDNWISNVEVFDVYQGEHVENDEKSIGLRITFQSTERTLQDDEILPLYQQIVEALEKQVKAKLRN